MIKKSALSLIILIATFALAQADNTSLRSITVSGQGTISITPDRARISIGVETTNRDIQEALSENNERMSRIISSLRDNGVAEEDIQTQGFNIYSRYGQASIGVNNSPNYIVNNTLIIHVRDLSRLGELVTLAVEDGANSMNGIQFHTSDTSEALQVARAAAVADARRKAEQLAALTDARLGAVVRIQENASGLNPQPAAQTLSLESSAVPLQAGQNRLSVTVLISWELE